MGSRHDKPSGDGDGKTTRTNQSAGFIRSSGSAAWSWRPTCLRAWAAWSAKRWSKLKTAESLCLKRENERLKTQADQFQKLWQVEEARRRLAESRLAVIRRALGLSNDRHD